MLSFLIVLLYAVDITLPVVVSAMYFYSVFDFKHSKIGFLIWNLLGMGFVALNTTLVNALFSSFGPSAQELFAPWHRTIRLLIFLAVYLSSACVYLHGSFYKKLYHVLLFSFSYLVCEYGFAILVDMTHQRYASRTVGEALLSLLQYGVFYLLVLLFFYVELRFFVKKSLDMTDKQYLVMLPMPIIFLGLMMLSLELNGHRFNLILFLSLIIMNLCIMALYRGLMITSRRIALEQYQAKENSYLQQQLKGEKEIERLRHDMKNMLLSISGDLQLGEVERAQEKIHVILEDIKSTNVQITGSKSLDVILAPKVQAIHQANIPFESDFQIMSDQPFRDHLLDLSVILGNLMDNAIEASLRLPEDAPRFIHMQIKQTPTELSVLISNRSNTIKLSKDGAQDSEKGRNRTGIGIASIRERVSALDGYSSFHMGDGIFQVLVQIPLAD